MIQRKRTQTGRTYGPSKRRRQSGAAYTGAMPRLTYYQPRQPQAEWKYLDTTVSVAVNTTGTYTLLNGLVPGAGASQRVGMKVAIRSLELRFVGSCDLVGGLAQTNRFIILRDGQANGAAPAALTDFLNTGTYLGVRALINRRRFKILRDRAYELTPVAGDYSRKTFHIYMKFSRPIITEYNAGVAGTIADIATNSLYLITLGSEALGNSDGALNGQARIRFTDL